ncbi:MAG TPA: hypothetical protein PK689_05945, partial [Kiritimatiellia bacterium]|nr:hypothetical protein [Kiritimatiellia bacterium]
RLAAVSHVLAHGPVAQQLLANPAWAARLEADWAYQPFQDGRGGVGTRRVAATPAAPEVVLKMKDLPPRVAAVESLSEVPDEEALRTLADPAFTPFSAVLLPPGSGVPPPPARSGDVRPARLDVARVLPGRYEFTVENAAPVVVRVAEKHDPNWTATVNGKAAPVLRTDYLFQGVYLPEAGRHDVVLRHAPSNGPVAMQGAGLLAGLAAAACLAAGSFRRRKENAA